MAEAEKLAFDDAPVQDAPTIGSVTEEVRVVLTGRKIANSARALCVSIPDLAPLYYLPSDHVDVKLLHPSGRTAHSDWGGRIAYFHLIGPSGLIRNAVFFHPEPPPFCEGLRGYLAFFPQCVDEVWVGTERLLNEPVYRAK